MTKRLATNMSQYYMRKGIIADDERDVYSYGFELVLSALTSIVLLLTVAAVLGIVINASAFLLSFILLRAFGGGYHAKTHRGCIVAFFVVFIIFSYANSHIPVAVVPAYILAGAATSSRSTATARRGRAAACTAWKGLT